MKLLREPLVHFLALGGLLFAVFAVAERVKEQPATVNRITVTPAVVAALEAGFQRSSGHPPDATERQGLIDDYVREEVLVREARGLGLDRDDPVVRAQLRRRMEQRVENQTPAARDAAYRELRGHYEVVVEKPAAAKSP